MRRLRAVVVGLAVVPLFAHAAELTRVASSFEEGHPFGVFIDVGFDRTQRLESIGREKHAAPDPTIPNDIQLLVAPELRYVGVDYRLNLDLHAGLWHDVEFHYGIPLVFSQTEEWWLSSLTSPVESTVLKSCVQANGSPVPTAQPTCPSAPDHPGGVPMFSAPISTTTGSPQVTRGAFGNMRFGLSWAAFNQLRDETKPTWVVGLEYEAPTADRLDPTTDTQDTNNPLRGALGDRIHKYQLWSAFSRRIGLVDPYVKVSYTLPYRGPGWYSNCDHLDPALMGTPANCNSTEWTRDATGILPPYYAELVAGSEFNVLDQPAKHQKFILDARAHTRYVSSGRYYNELSGLTKKLMYTSDYIQVGGSLALLAGVADYLTLRARATLAYETDKVLSNEPLGKDLNNNGKIDVQANPAEVNPTFDYRYDLVARQFRSSATWVFGVQVNASFNF